MTQRIVVGVMLLVSVVCAQRRIDPRNTYNRVIAVVPLVGSGTPADPKRPEYAPWPAGQSATGILAFTFEPSDDGHHAIVEFVARDRSAFQAIFQDKSITYFEKGRVSRATIETAVKPFRKDFSLDTFGMVMP